MAETCSEYTTVQLAKLTRNTLNIIPGGTYDEKVKNLMSSIISSKPSQVIKLPRYNESIPSGEKVEAYELILNDGILNDIYIGFPPGPSGKCGIKVIYSEKNIPTYIIPSTSDENAWILHDNYVMETHNLNIKVKGGGKLVVQAYNAGDYSHILQVTAIVN